MGQSSGLDRWAESLRCGRHGGNDAAGERARFLLWVVAVGLIELAVVVWRAWRRWCCKWVDRELFSGWVLEMWWHGGNDAAGGLIFGDS